jgi:cytochrome P450
MVLEDTILADKYFLKKNSVIQIAGGILGRDPVVWGVNGKDFDPYRFLVESKSEGGEAGRRVAAPMPEGVSSAAFRAFGGGTVICPGRHFAQTELMVFSAMVALLFDITDVDGGPMKLPEKDEMRIPLSVMKPVAEPMVRIKRRLGRERVQLDVRL